MDTHILACVATLALAGAHAPARTEPQATGTGKTQEQKAPPPLVDPELPAYERVTTGVSGNLSSVGSDTLNNLMAFWAEEFRKTYPSVKIQIEGKGSGTAPPALIEGTAQLGPMSREMKPSEIDAFEKRFGHPPTAVRIAIDALAVYVNKDNPLEKLTLPEVDAIFSRTRQGGFPRAITRWEHVGLTGEWESKPIRLYGRNSASGTYGYFKKIVLFKGDYKDSVKEQPGSASVVNGVAEDLYGIGYSGIGYRTSDVKTLDLAKAEGEPYYTTEPNDVLSGKYPLARFLYIYVNKTPGRELGPLVQEFLAFVLSEQGQTIVVEKGGYMPIPAAVARQERTRIVAR